MSSPSKPIFAIDPGTEESGYALLDWDLRPSAFGKIPNTQLIGNLRMLLSDHEWSYWNVDCVSEMVASYGMPVGREVFETCVWIGRFSEALESLHAHVGTVYRKDEKMALCGSPRANDATIRQALIDRFGPVGTKASPGWFYGVHKDAWAAIAVGVTYHDLQILKERT